MNYVSSNIYAEYTLNWATTIRSNFWAAGISKEEIPHLTVKREG